MAAFESDADGWRLAAVCRPAQEVGGDFFTELPGRNDGEHVVVYGDVSGKSISGALMMMATHEVLNALALAHPDPEELLRLANERLYRLAMRMVRVQAPGGFQNDRPVAGDFLITRPRQQSHHPAFPAAAPLRDELLVE